MFIVQKQSQNIIIDVYDHIETVLNQLNEKFGVVIRKL